MHHWFNIMLLVDGVCTLLNVFITDPTSVVDVTNYYFSIVTLLWQLRLKQRTIFITIDPQQTCLSLQLWRFSNVFTSRQINFFINVLTWRAKWRVLKTFFQFCTQFICKRCKWHSNIHKQSLFWHNLYAKGVSGIITYINNLYFETCNCGRWRFH